MQEKLLLRCVLGCLRGLCGFAHELFDTKEERCSCDEEDGDERAEGDPGEGDDDEADATSKEGGNQSGCGSYEIAKKWDDIGEHRQGLEDEDKAHRHQDEAQRAQSPAKEFSFLLFCGNDFAGAEEAFVAVFHFVVGYGDDRFVEFLISFDVSDGVALVEDEQTY